MAALPPAKPTQRRSDWPAVAARIRSHAPAADRGDIGLADDLADLHQSGILHAIVQETGAHGSALQAATMLRRLGRVSLPVGRIVEGHANALKLIGLYGAPEQQARAALQAASGVIFGVWGADGTPGASLAWQDDAHAIMQGHKRFCSGIGVVGQAILTADTRDGVQLVLAFVTDPARADSSDWQVSGMRATASGAFDLNGLDVERLGDPGDYLREPYFEGGIWRYCALHTGGLEALAEFVRIHVGTSPDPHQMHRLARLVMLAETARLHVQAAALAVESGQSPETAVPRCLLAREAVEQACLDGLSIAERALGTFAFQSGSPVDLCRRDLAFFLRQANLDGKLTQAATALVALPAEVGEQW